MLPGKVLLRIGVAGDIHGNDQGLLRALDEMNQPDMIFFTGDGFREISRLRWQTSIPIQGVVGNCDFSSDYPGEQLLHLEQYSILLTHGHLYGVKNGLTRICLAAQAKKVQLVVFGHTHQPTSDIWQGIRLFNPGSLSEERPPYCPSYGMIIITTSGIDLQLRRL
jgi:putative phosphoesterase